MLSTISRAALARRRQLLPAWTPTAADPQRRLRPRGRLTLWTGQAPHLLFHTHTGALWGLHWVKPGHGNKGPGHRDRESDDKKAVTGGQRHWTNR